MRISVCGLAVPSMLSEPAARSGSSTAAVGDKRLVVLRGASFGGLAGGVIALFFLCCTGFMMVIREYAQYHVVSHVWHTHLLL